MEITDVGWKSHQTRLTHARDRVMNDQKPLLPPTLVPTEVSFLIIETFDRDHISDLRHRVAGQAESVGLAGERLHDFVLAVNELLTNAVRHGGGRGSLHLWHEMGVVYCEVADSGHGISVTRLRDRSRPALKDTGGGWGLWLIRQLTDEMVIATGPDGTTIRISIALSGSKTASAKN